MQVYVISRGSEGEVAIRAMYSRHLASLRTQDGRWEREGLWRQSVSGLMTFGELVFFCPRILMKTRAFILQEIVSLNRKNRKTSIIGVTRTIISESESKILEKNKFMMVNAIFFKSFILGAIFDLLFSNFIILVSDLKSATSKPF